MYLKTLIPLISTILLFLTTHISSQTPDIDPSQTVNPATGEMMLNIPLANVQGKAGESFPVRLGYKAGIRAYQEASPVGLGFSMNVPTISRKVVLVPDDVVKGIKEIKEYV